MTSNIDLITPHNFLIVVGCVLIWYGIAFLKKQSIEENNSEKVSLTQSGIPQCNMKLFDFKLSNGLILIILGVVLQMFSIYNIPQNKNDFDKTNNNIIIKDNNQSSKVLKDNQLDLNDTKK